MKIGWVTGITIILTDYVTLNNDSCRTSSNIELLSGFYQGWCSNRLMVIWKKGCNVLPFFQRKIWKAQNKAAVFMKYDKDLDLTEPFLISAYNETWTVSFLLWIYGSYSAENSFFLSLRVILGLICMKHPSLHQVWPTCLSLFT